MTISRRRLLECALGFAAVGWLPSRTASRPDPAAWLLALPGNVRSARRLGERYLVAFPEEADAGRLVAAMRGHAGAHRLGARMAIRADFAAGRTVEVQGWILSRTEARICALVALHASRPV